MNTDTLKGSWRELKGKVKQKWGQLTDDDLARIEGNVDELTGTVQRRYGLAREEAERQCNEFYKECGCC